MKLINKTDVKEWLLKEVFPFNSIDKGEKVNLIIKSSQFIQIRPKVYLESFKEDEVTFDLGQAIFTRNSFNVKFKDYCYYESTSENDIDIIFCIDSNKDNIFTVDITDKLITSIATHFNMINVLNKACNKVRDEYFTVDSLIVDVVNENIFVNFIDSKDQYEIRHAYNDLQFFRIIQDEKPEFYKVFSVSAFCNS